MLLLMIDNYDSFTFNLVLLFREFRIDVEVFRNDEIRVSEIADIEPDWICISPGPGTPDKAGISKQVVQQFGGSIPLFGVCLGMQAINEAFGGTTVEASVPVHGKCSLVRHSGEGLFSGLPSPFSAARYHSLQVSVSSPELVPLARSEDGVVMGLQHCKLPICGVQFHPESFMTSGIVHDRTRAIADQEFPLP